MTTVSDLLDSALDAFTALATVTDSIEDEWQYVADLGTVWRSRLEAVRAARGTDEPPPGTTEAFAALAAEAGRVTDPHRAIDWLSTLPQVALAALDEPT